MTRFTGGVRNDGNVVTSALSTDHVLLQAAPTANQSYAVPKLITVANLLASPSDYTVLNLGSSGVQGTLNIYSSTATTGKLSITNAASTGNYTTLVELASQGAAYTYTIPNAGASASFMMTQGNQTVVGNNTFSGTTQANTLNVGASGTAGTLKAYPGTASHGYVELLPVGNTGNYNTIISDVSSLGQSTTYTLPDPGAATANILLDTGNISVAGNKTFTGTTQINTLNVGASGTAGSFSVYPATASEGHLALAAVANVGNYAATISPISSLGQATVYTLNDPGAATAQIVTTGGAQTIAGVKTFSSVPIGTQYVIQAYIPTIAALGGQLTMVHSAFFSGTITEISVSTSASFSTSNIVLTGYVYAGSSGTAITTGVVTLVQSGSAIGQTVAVTPTAANTFVSGNSIAFTITGGTAGGNAIITLFVTRTA